LSLFGSIFCKILKNVRKKITFQEFSYIVLTIFKNKCLDENFAKLYQSLHLKWRLKANAISNGSLPRLPPAPPHFTHPTQTLAPFEVAVKLC
jgi:hypothetical protein